MSTDLRDRITAAINHAEQTAQAVEKTWPGPWTSTRTGWVLDAQGDQVDGVSVDLARQMIANSPAAVLRRCAADRRVLDRHRSDSAVESSREFWACVACSIEIECNSDRSCTHYDTIPWPCPDICDLADRYGIEVDS